MSPHSVECEGCGLNRPPTETEKTVTSLRTALAIAQTQLRVIAMGARQPSSIADLALVDIGREVQADKRRAQPYHEALEKIARYVGNGNAQVRILAEIARRAIQ